MPFGQLVIGPPGSGKTTYCKAVEQYLRLTGRKTAIINLDPANDTLPYQAAVDVSDLVHLDQVMEELKLGPNGGLVYALDYLETNIDWLMERLQLLEAEGYYFLFDLPGQVELFTMHGSLKRIVEAMAAKHHYRLAAVHLVDAHLCSDPSKYISALLQCLSCQLHLELPHVNVLSKIDLIQQYGQLDFNLDFYTEVQDLSHLILSMGTDRFSKKYRKLSEGLCELVQDFALVNFAPMSVTEPDSIREVMNLVDKANGAALAGLGNRNPYANAWADVAGVQADVWTGLNEKYVCDDVAEHSSLAEQGVANPAARSEGMKPSLGRRR